MSYEIDIIEYKKCIENSSGEMSRLKEGYEQTIERCRTERAASEETLDNRISSMKVEVRSLGILWTCIFHTYQEKTLQEVK